MHRDKHSVQRRNSGISVAVLTSGPSSGPAGGAEQLFQGLLEGVRAIGCTAELIYIPADEPSFEAILNNHARCSTLDLSRFDVVVSTKAPTYAIRHPAHVIYLVHTVRVFDDMFEDQFIAPTLENFQERATLHALEFEPLLHAKSRLSIGKEIADRLYRWRGMHADVLHPPLASNSFRQGPTGDYFFLPGRLHRWKRVDLVIKAVRASSYPLKLKIAGAGEGEAELKQIAEDDPRIEFLGRIDEEQLVNLYAGALAVPFMPLREDFGYITLEAFASGKPVVTCTDSGEPTRLVQHGYNGLICQPDPLAVMQALETLYSDRDFAAEMGRQGAQVAADMPAWPEVAQRLIDAALSPVPRVYGNSSKVCVLDMQPIDPPVGGGRLRLLGLYHNLGSGIDCTYVGTYDWPGEPYRSHQLSETLREIDVPLSDAHHVTAATLAQRAGGKVVIDLAFSQQATLSPEYVSTACAEIAKADVVVFSHPWVYPLVKDRLRPGQVVIYDSHNVEGFLRAQLLDEHNPTEADLLRRVVQDEYDVGCRADWILACSHEDLLRFHRIYGFSPSKMRVVPNGVMAFNNNQPTPENRVSARRELGIDAEGFVAIFIGSSYGPNVQAAEFIVRELAPMLPQVTFVVAGGVGVGMRPGTKNVVCTGQLDEAGKYRWLHSSDLAINPMMSGSGTNIKMFDFMAMALPVVSTAIGARGIDSGGLEFMRIAEPTPESFASAITGLMDRTAGSRLGREARKCVEDGYAWERISAQLGVFLSSRKRLAGQARPLFSVVVPTYERHGQLDDLIHCLQQQIERDFEVILIDQSAKPWVGADKSYGFPLTYSHCPVKGAVRARNTGAMLAQGKIIAFVDDDCQPSESWLINARFYFRDSSVVGVEGLIHSDHLNEPDWRPVTNVGFEGIGFMTANLMVRASVFQYLGGFDLQFDKPHFREDTDFGWRLQDVGSVPYAPDVKVFHPAQPRCNDRESAVERARFFQKDARLYQKHPERYQQLFWAEQHYSKTPGFRENLTKGFECLGIEIPKWLAESFHQVNG